MEVPASHSQGGWGWGSLSPSADLSGRRIKVPPSHVGTECKNAVCSDGRARGQGRWVHLPQRHRDCDCVVSPCVSQASLPRAGHRAPDQGAASLQKRRDLYPPLLPQASLPSSPASLGKFPPPPPAPAEASTPPQPALCHLGPWGWSSAGSRGTISLKRQLPHVSLQCTHPEHRDTEAKSPSLGKGWAAPSAPGTSHQSSHPRVSQSWPHTYIT